MDTSGYIRCHESLCNGLSCFRNLTLSRSRVKLIGVGSFASRATKKYGVGFMAVEQDDPLGVDLPLPASETGHASHMSPEHAAVVGHLTVTEVLAVPVVGRKTR